MENLFAFKHWLVSGPEMARTITQFEKLIIIVVIITCFLKCNFKWILNCDVTSIHT